MFHLKRLKILNWSVMKRIIKVYYSDPVNYYLPQYPLNGFVSFYSFLGQQENISTEIFKAFRPHLQSLMLLSKQNLTKMIAFHVYTWVAGTQKVHEKIYHIYLFTLYNLWQSVGDVRWSVLDRPVTKLAAGQTFIGKL